MTDDVAAEAVAGSAASAPPERGIGVGLEAADVSWSVAGTSILHDITTRAQPGRMLGLLGPNGAGKTSLLRILAGLRRPDTGRVCIDGVPVHNVGRKDRARTLAIVEQTTAAHTDVSVEQAVAIGRTPYRGPFTPVATDDRRAVDRALHTTGLSAYRHRDYGTLSGGEQQRAQVARALAQEPRLVLLDEPTNHLDIRFQIEMLALLHAAPLTVVTALHDLNLAARFCDDVVVLDAGRVIAAGTPETVLTAELIARVYGVQSVVERSPHTGAVQITFLGVDHEPVGSGHGAPL